MLGEVIQGRIVELRVMFLCGIQYGTSCIYGIFRCKKYGPYDLWYSMVLVYLPTQLGDLLVGGLEHFFIFPYIGNNTPI